MGRTLIFTFKAFRMDPSDLSGATRGQSYGDRDSLMTSFAWEAKVKH